MFPILDFIKYQKPGVKLMKKFIRVAKERLAGIGEAKGMGFTHTNPAMTDFPR
jgi:hypothetical protein